MVGRRDPSGAGRRTAAARGDRAAGSSAATRSATPGPRPASSTWTSCCTATAPARAGARAPPGRRGRVPGPARQARAAAGAVAPAGRGRVGAARDRRDLRGAAGRASAAVAFVEVGDAARRVAARSRRRALGASRQRVRPAAPDLLTAALHGIVPPVGARAYLWARAGRWWRLRAVVEAARRRARRDLREGLLERRPPRPARRPRTRVILICRTGHDRFCVSRSPNGGSQRIGSGR